MLTLLVVSVDKDSQKNDLFRGIGNKRRLQTISIDNAWSNKNFLYYLTFRMLQHTVITVHL